MKGRCNWSVALIALLGLLTIYAVPTWAQAVGGAEEARPAGGDPGISSMVVMDQLDFRVLRDYAEPGATRRLHSHDDVKWIVSTLVTGKLLLTIAGQAPVEVTPGQVIDLGGSTKHTFKNIGTLTAKIVEVFGKAERQSYFPLGL